MLAEDLQRIIEGEAVADAGTLAEYSHDYSIFEVMPQTVVFPKNTEDIKKLVRFASEQKRTGKNISLTARSAGSDMSGGPLNDSVILSFTRHMNGIKEITNNNAVVEPGVYFRDLEKELDSRGLLYPPYPASKDLCALGGMIANNSGGEKTLAYGKTENYVDSLRVVLSDGELHSLSPISGAALETKLQEQSFEGNIYRKLHKLLEENYADIQNAKPKVSKNSCGYALWSVWDKQTFNLAKLFVGSQGTLGIITEATLRLVPQKKYSRLVVIFAKSLEPVPKLVESLLAYRPESIESYDDRTLGLALKFAPAMIRLMKGNAIKLGFQFLPELGMLLRGGLPKMVLLVQFASDDEQELDARVSEAIITSKKFPVQSRLVHNAEEAEKYWTIRRQSFALLHSRVKGKYAAPFVDDIIVQPKYMPEVLPQINAVLDRYKNKLLYTIAGHPGDGNFHIIPLMNLSDPETRVLIPKIAGEIYGIIFRYDGSMSAEHNDGLIRSPYLKEMYGEKIYGLFREVKNIFDPQNIFNPGKKVGASLDYSTAHIRTR